MFYAVAPSILGVKNLSPTETKSQNYSTYFQCIVSQCKIMFKMSKKQIHFLIMVFISITNMTAYLLLLPKRNLYIDWWCLIDVFSSRIGVFTFNILWFNGISFCQMSKKIKFIFWMVIYRIKNMAVYIFFQNPIV